VKTYRELFRVPEFTPLFITASARYAASTMSGLALSTIVFTRTGSPLLSVLAMFGSSFAQLIGVATLLSTADRARPRPALTALGLGFTIATLALAAPGLPVSVLLGIELGSGLLNAATGGIQWGLMNEIVPDGGYILGRSIFNMTVGVMHILGYAAGGALVALISSRGALLSAAGLYLLSTAMARVGLSDRPPRILGRPSIRETWSGNKRLWSSPARRSVYLALWVPNGLIVGCEALFVPYDPHSAAILFVAAASGMLAADTALGRFLPVRWRPRLISPLRLLLAAPYVLFAAQPPIALALIAVTIASLGYGASLLLQERLLALTPPSSHGQALGLHNSGMLAMQAIGATLAGLVSEHTSPATAITIMAIASLLVTVALTPRLRVSPSEVLGFAH
jgi:MFS family permease